MKSYLTGKMLPDGLLSFLKERVRLEKAIFFKLLGKTSFLIIIPSTLSRIKSCQQYLKPI